MARPLRLHIPGALYHVMSRGNAKQQIFFDVVDRREFLATFAEALNRFRVDCLAYCQMDTHFHLLLTPRAFSLSRMMQQLNSTYSQYFNRRHQRVGHVLQGRFKALLVDRDLYFHRVLRYIAMNPVTAGMVQHPAEWEWSSYRSTAGLSQPASFLTLTEVWKTFHASDVAKAQDLYARFVVSAGDDEWPPDPFRLGSDTFQAQVAPEIEPHRSCPDIVYAERFACRPLLASMFPNCQDRQSCNTSIREAFHRYGYTLQEIGEFLGLHSTTIWRRIRRAQESDAVEAGRRRRKSRSDPVAAGAAAMNQDLTP